MEPLEALGWGALGAIAVHLLPLMRDPAPRRRVLLADDATWVDYLLAAAVRVAVGGLVALAYAQDTSDMTALLAMNVGAAWPVIIRGANRAAPELKPPRTG